MAKQNIFILTLKWFKAIYYSNFPTRSKRQKGYNKIVRSLNKSQNKIKLF